jgi:uncharacterized membrane protein YciS (DUF1049 family)
MSPDLIDAVLAASVFAVGLVVAIALCAGFGALVMTQTARANRRRDRHRARRGGYIA